MFSLHFSWDIFVMLFFFLSSFFSLLLLLLIVPFSIFEGISLFEFTPPLPLTLLLGSSFLLSFLLLLLLLLLLLRHASKKMKHPERYRFNIHPSLVPHLIFFDFPSVFWGLRACVRPSVSNAPEMIIPLVLSVMDAQLGFCPIRRLQDSLCGVHHSIRIEGCGGLYLLFIHFFFGFVYGDSQDSRDSRDSRDFRLLLFFSWRVFFCVVCYSFF